ncbi:MAG TPA: type 2 isopentenyl-diphosphate Delta-isomerase, partial [Blastocatellia bacterium]|nr:type 2 isopentenyl-diphosphate Delta-isomerase [Blastocatellia bacterium]
VVGFALPVLRAYVSGGIEGVESFLNAFCDELRVALMLCGCARVGDLTADHAVIGGRLLEWIERRRLSAQ